MTTPLRTAPVVAHPTTGEILTPDEINSRIIALTEALEGSNNELTGKVREHAAAASLYADVYDEALLAATAKNKEQREAEARKACRVATTPLGHPLSKRKDELERDITVLRDTQKNLRSIISGFQTVSANVRTAMGAWMGAGAA